MIFPQQRSCLLRSLQFLFELFAKFTQVLRYSALIFGIFYGFQHQRSITSNAKVAHAEAEYQHKVDLIQKAKAEWAKKTLPPQAKTASGDSTYCCDETAPIMLIKFLF